MSNRSVSSPALTGSDEFAPARGAAGRPDPTILLVDDDSSVRGSICRVLRAEAIHVIAARGVKDALDHLFWHTPQLVITDLYMAPLAGWDLIAFLRSRHPGLPVFVITALARPFAGEVMDEIAAYFQKPLDLEVFVAAIRRQLGGPGSGQCATTAAP